MELMGNVRFCCRITKCYFYSPPPVFSSHISPRSVPATRIFSSTPHFSIDCISSGVYQRGSWRGATFLWLRCPWERRLLGTHIPTWMLRYSLLRSIVIGWNLPFSSNRVVGIADNGAPHCYSLWTGATDPLPRFSRGRLSLFWHSSQRIHVMSSANATVDMWLKMKKRNRRNQSDCLFSLKSLKFWMSRS